MMVSNANGVKCPLRCARVFALLVERFTRGLVEEQSVAAPMSPVDPVEIAARYPP